MATQAERVLRAARSFRGTCQACGAVLVQKPKEGPKRFATRTCCDRACRTAALTGRIADRPLYEERDLGYDTPCWIWVRSLTSNGYGQLGGDARGKVAAHRWMYEEERGPIPEGAELDHLCHTASADCPGGPACLHRRCVNPEHLEPVTHAENGRRGVNTRLSVDAARAIRDSPLGYRRLAAVYGVHRSTIRSVKRGVIWKDA